MSQEMIGVLILATALAGPILAQIRSLKNELRAQIQRVETEIEKSEARTNARLDKLDTRIDSFAGELRDIRETLGRIMGILEIRVRDVMTRNIAHSVPGLPNVIEPESEVAEAVE